MGILESTQIACSDEGWSLTFAAAICASKPLAIDLGVKIDPPLSQVYQTEPGSWPHKLFTGRSVGIVETYFCRSGTVEINP